MERKAKDAAEAEKRPDGQKTSCLVCDEGAVSGALKEYIRVTGKRMEMRGIDSIIPYARNARVHDASQIAKLRGSLRQFGFVKPLAIDEQGNLLAGHGILEAARAEGMTEVPCVVVTDLSEVDRQAFILADNALAELSAWDEKMRSLEVKRLSSLGANTELLGLKTDKLGTVDVNAYTRAAPGQGDEAGPAQAEAPAGGTPAPATPDGVQLMLGDCLERMRDIPDGSVDMVLCDLPYGTTNCSWDTVISFDPLWAHYKRVIKENGAILLFSTQPFTTDLIQSNRGMFRYEIIWEKTQWLGFLNAKKMPMRAHENICVFYKKLPTYNPIKYRVEDVAQMGRTRNGVNGKFYEQYIGRTRGNGGKTDIVGEFRKDEYSWTETGERYPGDVIKFSNWNGALFGNTDNHINHPTAKPVPLMEYLIKTYTNPGETVLDNCMGSGTTGVACVRTGRRFIGIELDPGYFETAQRRIAGAQAGEPDEEEGGGDHARTEATD